jgi:triacylglycerol lipase
MAAIPKLGSPIVLVPGLLGFDRIEVAGRTIHRYFPGIPEFLESVGNRVLVARPSPTDGVARRAVELGQLLDKELGNEPVHIIAHSMGGLDARYLISCLDMASRVLSLTTIGTPHRGSPFADWGVRHLDRVLSPVFDFLGLPRQAFYDLTTDACRTFNETVVDAPGVRYFSVAGRHHGRWDRPEWLLPFSIVQAAEGDNDGMVSVASATYGEACEVWDADHVGLVSWLNPLAEGVWDDRSRRFAALVGRLADERF